MASHGRREQDGHVHGHPVGQRRTATVVIATVLAMAILFVRPASACSCGPPDVDRVVADETGTTALVVAQRLDHDGGPGGELRLLATLAGGPVAGPVQARFDDGASCDPGVIGGGVAALVLERDGGRWSTTTCGMLPVADAVAAADGTLDVDPRAGPPTLLLAGGFGGARLAAVDAAGGVAAWGEGAGRAAGMALCPGGEVAVEVAVTDRETIVQRRSLPDLEAVGDPIPVGGAETWEAGVVCHDADADRVVVALPRYGEGGSIVVVRGGEVERHPARIQAADAGGSTLAVVVADAGDPFSSATVASVDRSGGLQHLVTRPGVAFDRVDVSPTGAHVLLLGYPPDQPGDLLVTVAADGSSRASRALDGYREAGWLSDDELWLRDGDVGTFGAVAPEVQVLDAGLVPTGERPGLPGRMVGLPDGSVLRHGYQVLPSVTRDGGVQAVADLRLVDAAAVAVLDPDAVLTDAEPETNATPGQGVSTEVGPGLVEDPRRSLWRWGGLGLLLAITMAVVVLVRRRHA